MRNESITAMSTSTVVRMVWWYAKWSRSAWSLAKMAAHCDFG